MRLLSLVVTSVVLSASVSAYDVPWQRLRDSADAYLQHCVSKSESDSLASKLNSRVRQKLSDNPDASEDVAMRNIMLDWAAGATGDLAHKKADAVNQACYYFVVFHDKGFDVPHQIRSQLSEGNVKEIMQYLDDEVAKHKKK
jgi:hypothetical protein